MTFELAQFLIFAGILCCLTPILGTYMYNVFSGNRTFIHCGLEWLENLSYRLSGVNKKEMTWVEYTKSLLVFNLFGFLTVFFLQLFQGYLPLNPQEFPSTSWQLAFNTAISFTTNTNWQSYAGETTLSYLTQMLGLTVQNFLSAATGIAVFLTLVRGITRKTSNSIGNFWIDLVRSIVYLFLPLSIIIAFILVGQGVVQTFSAYVTITTLENTQQIIPLGPVASQEAIKQLGTNGGGFFGANSAHPFENPTALSNFIEIVLIILIPSSLVYTYGLMIRSKKHAYLLLLIMLIFWSGGLTISLFSQKIYNPTLNVSQALEGQETRFGMFNTILWSVSTTATSNGSVNNMISSLSPLAGGIALLNIMLGEMIFGGIGVGLCTIIMYSLLTVFLSGLMIGRTPEYMGKKIEKKEIQWVTVSLLTPGALILLGAGISSVLPEALSSLGNAGPHGLTEILYAFSSAAGNNGSAFAGLNANTNYYNLVLGLVMFLGRLSIVIPSLAIAGLLARKKITPVSAGTFSTDTFLFAALLLGIIPLVGALTFFPALSLGPLVEQLLMLKGKAF